MSLEEAKGEIDELYDEYYKKFTHKDPYKKQWYAIQMITNVLEQRRLNLIEKRTKDNNFSLPNIF